MFTGIVQDVGRIVSLERRAGDVRLRIAVKNLMLDHTTPGDSIAVSGVCLTALDLDKTPGAQSFAADVSNETLSLTTLGALSVGSRVNLEQSLDIPGYLIDLEIDLASHRELTERRHSLGVRDEIHTKIRSTHLVDREAHAIDGNRTFASEVSRETRRTTEAYPHRTRVAFDREHLTQAIDMTGDEMSA